MIKLHMLLFPSGKLFQYKVEGSSICVISVLLYHRVKMSYKSHLKTTDKMINRRLLIKRTKDITNYFVYT